MTGVVDVLPSTAFWEYSNRVYALPGVADACLRLQDRSGADVNLVLFAAWAATRGPALPEEKLNLAFATAHEWSKIVIRPLRAIRRGMKVSPLSAAGSTEYETLRERVEEAELEGERLLQCALSSFAPEGPSTAHRAVTVAAGNALRLFQKQGVELDEETLVDLRSILLTLFDAPPHLLNELVSAPVVVTVNGDGHPTGEAQRLGSHLPPTTRHLAVSVVVVSDEGRWLLQRRVDEKCAFGGFWANSCCTHPYPDEAPIDTARRRVREELGLDVERIEAAGAFAYEATDETTGFIENEYDHVFVAFVAGEPEPTLDPKEIAETEWLERPAALTRAEEPSAAPWYPHVAALANQALARLD